MPSNRELLAEEKSRLNCQDCAGRGYLSHPAGGVGYKAYCDLSVCRCIESQCFCEKKPPYMWYDEKTSELRACLCRKVRTLLSEIKRLYQVSSIPPKYRFRQIHDFEITHEEPSITRCLTQAYDNAEHFLEELGRQKVMGGDLVRGWYFHGLPGSGKTMLSCLILNEAILRYQYRVRYVKVARDFLDQIRASYNQESGFYGKGNNIINELYQIDLLVLDDFGVQQDTEWEKRMLYNLIDTRYEYAKTTIITSNLEPEELRPLFGGRILSRIKEMAQIQDFVGPDYREKLA